MSSTDASTIRDFGDQWSRYTKNEGFYASRELLADFCGPLVSLEELVGKRAADVGSGTGRWATILLAAGVADVVAVEPSDAFAALQENTRAFGDRIRLVRGPGEALPAEPPLDFVLSYGVLHHVTDPKPIVDACHRALKPGGRLLVWLYGREGNEAYLRLALPLRRITTRLPHVALSALSSLLNVALDVYVPLARAFPLPLAGYARNVLGKLTREHRRLVIYDQLNPAYARYYTRDEARSLLERSGFVNVRLHHRHGYSWSVIGERPPVAS